MGFTVSLEADHGQSCPHWFTGSDSKALVQHLAVSYAWGASDGPNVLAWLEPRLGVSFEMLARIGSEEVSLEEIVEMGGSEDDWRKDQERNRRSWQPVEDFTGGLEELLRRIEAKPEVFEQIEEELELDAGDIDYFEKGVFTSDLRDLLEMARWAKETGAARVRITTG